MGAFCVDTRCAAPVLGLSMSGSSFRFPLTFRLFGCVPHCQRKLFCCQLPVSQSASRPVGQACETELGLHVQWPFSRLRLVHFKQLTALRTIPFELSLQHQHQHKSKWLLMRAPWPKVHLSPSMLCISEPSALSHCLFMQTL